MTQNSQSQNGPTFEEQMQRLEAILEKLSQESPLEESIQLFEEASSLLTQCQNSLKFAEARIEKLVVKSQQGQEKEGGSFETEPL